VKRRILFFFWLATLGAGTLAHAQWPSLYKERIDNNGKDHPGARCWPSGIPEKNNIPDGLKVVHLIESICEENSRDLPHMVGK
jgi:hypothetical protein